MTMTTTAHTTCSITDGGVQCDQPSVGTGPNGNVGRDDQRGPLCAYHVRAQRVTHGAAQRLGERWGWTWPEPGEPHPGAV
jgi:hypothetical protein